MASWPASAEPERKRKIIGEEFIRVFEEEAKKIGTGGLSWLQGTIYPDVIESGAGDAAVIKSHHNVGGLPDYVDFKEIIEPLRLLFKDEVRQLGRELGLPEYLVMRQPFPGPGLAIRVIGDITKEKAGYSARGGLHLPGRDCQGAVWTSAINQYFAVLTNMRSVGVMGDGRTYDYTLALRGVTTTRLHDRRLGPDPLRGAGPGLRPYRQRGARASTASSTTSPPSPPPPSSGNNCNNPPVRCNAADRWVFLDILSVCCQNALTVKKPCGKIDSRMKANWVRDI